MAHQEPLRRGIQIGLIAFAILIYVILIGVPPSQAQQPFQSSALNALFIFAMLRRPR